jgi:hypothetical protein
MGFVVTSLAIASLAASLQATFNRGTLSLCRANHDLFTFSDFKSAAATNVASWDRRLQNQAQQPDTHGEATSELMSRFVEHYTGDSCQRYGLPRCSLYITRALSALAEYRAICTVCCHILCFAELVFTSSATFSEELISTVIDLVASSTILSSFFQ